MLTEIVRCVDGNGGHAVDAIDTTTTEIGRLRSIIDEQSAKIDALKGLITQHNVQYSDMCDKLDSVLSPISKWLSDPEANAKRAEDALALMAPKEDVIADGGEELGEEDETPEFDFAVKSDD